MLALTMGGVLPRPFLTRVRGTATSPAFNEATTRSHGTQEDANKETGTYEPPLAVTPSRSAERDRHKKARKPSAKSHRTELTPPPLTFDFVLRPFFFSASASFLFPPPFFAAGHSFFLCP